MMARTTQWEYAHITQESDRPTIRIDYSAPHEVEVDDAPAGAFAFTLGELGGKGWELVSVTASWRADGAYVTILYFKRPHNDDRRLRD